MVNENISIPAKAYWKSTEDTRGTTFKDGVVAAHPHLGVQLVVYIDRLTKVTLVCNIDSHGEFEAVPHRIVNSPNGCCPKCKAILHKKVRSENKEEITKKMRATVMEKYGVDSVTKLPSTQEKINKTCMEKYGSVRISGTDQWKSDRRNEILSVSTSHLTEEQKAEYFDDDHIQALSKNGMALQEISELYDLSWDVIQHRFEVANLTAHRHKISLAEKEIHRFLLENNIEFEYSKRTLIGTLELDIYIPEMRIGIEFNGVFWHSCDVYDTAKKLRHKNKLDECTKNDIRLIQIWEDDFTLNKELVYTMLRNKLGITKSTINGRDCKIVEIDSTTYNNFLIVNHIQGINRVTTVRLGLQDKNNTLVSVMGFKKSSSNVNKYETENCFELTRFASMGVHGAFAKLIKYFKNNFDVESVYSFADLELVDQNNNVYTKNEFVVSHYIDVDYKYLDRAKNRVHKFNYRKNKFKSLGLDIENKTENQLAKEYGLRKCWDSGKICYIWNK